MRLLLLAVLALGNGLAQVKEYKPSRLNLFSRDQDVQMGKESADEVRKTMPVVNNKELTDYINRIGQRLAKSPHAGGYPFSFEVLNDPTINAFALPGGPMFVHTGLIAAVDNESQLAGVLAHEMSHVALRHGTTNVSKANLIQLPGLLLGSSLDKKGGLWAMAGQMGVTLGTGSILLRNSRDAEKEADLNGAQIMNDAGYDPTQMAIFFDKLQSGEGAKKDNGLVANLISDHPTPGRRVDYVTEQNKYLPKVRYSESEAGTLPRMKKIVASLPPPPKPAPQATTKAVAPQGQGSGQNTTAVPDPHPSGGFKTFNAAKFRMSYPDNWQVFQDQKSDAVTIAPVAGVVQGAVGWGMIVDTYAAPDKRANLQRDTTALIKQMMGENPNMKQTQAAKSVRVAGQNALVTPLESPSPFQGKKELDLVLTVARQDAIFYIVFIAPDSDWKATQPAYDQTVSSLQFIQ